MDGFMSDGVILTVIVSFIVILLGYFYYKMQETNDNNPNDLDQSKRRQPNKNSKSNKTKQNKQKNTSFPNGHGKVEKLTEADKFTHQFLYTTLKGHTGIVTGLAFSPNFQYLLSAGLDSTIHVWIAKEFANNDHKNFRTNLQFDRACRVAYSPDNKGFIIARAKENTLDVYRVGSKVSNSGGAKQANLGSHHVELYTKFKPTGLNGEVIGLDFSPNGQFIMCCTMENHLIVMTIRGVVMESLDVAEGRTYAAKISPSSKYIAVAGHYKSKNDMIVYRVEVDSEPQGKQTVKLSPKPLYPGTKGVYDFDFNAISDKVAVLGIDSRWKILDYSGPNVSTECNGSIQYERAETNDEEISNPRPTIKWSQNGLVLLIGAGNTLSIFSIRMGGLCLARIQGIHGNESIRGIVFSDSDRYFVTCGDRYIRIFHNVPGMLESRRHMEYIADKKATSKNVRQRLRAEIDELNEFLKKYNLDAFTN